MTQQRRIRSHGNEMLLIEGRHVIVKIDPTITDAGFLVHAIVLARSDAPIDRHSIEGDDLVIARGNKAFIERVNAWIADHFYGSVAIEPPYAELRDEMKSQSRQEGLLIAEDLRTAVGEEVMQ
ncbi:MAG: hypothetical protein ACFCA4_18765 [Cyanophyceae cyanobacterium]